MSVISAPVTNISRASLHDGPGIRTVVYLKGCGMRCTWCHNPETLSGREQLLYHDSRCIGCGRCLEICPQQCHSVADGVHLLDRTNCTTCGLCADACPNQALSICGEEMTVEQVMVQLRKDAHFFRRSGGGVTVSGGECLLRPAFTAALLKQCREEGIHTCIETALGVGREAVDEVLPYVDLFFCDCKLPTPEKHLAYTGREQAGILDNLRYIASSGKQVIVRIPMIPGVNDSDADLSAFGELLPTLGVKDVELLRYNNLGQSKYESAGMTFVSYAPEPQTPERMEQMASVIRAACPELNIFYVI